MVNILAMGTVLVTGAAGFIGFSVAQRLAGDGQDVLAVDDISPSYSVDLKLERAGQLAKDCNVRLHIGDLSKTDRLLSLMEECSVSGVIHLAARPGVREPLSRIRQYMDSNVSAFGSTLSAAVASNVQYFIYASSSSVYGSLDRFAYEESEEALKPVSIYGATKLANEKIASAVSSASGIPTVGLRLFTVYGPWGRPDMMPWQTVAAALSGRKLRLNGNGRAVRDFTYIDDVTEAIARLTNNVDYSELPSILNVGGGATRETKDLISIVNRLNPDQIVLEHSPWDVRDVERTCASTDLISSVLNWQPSVQLEDGMSEFFAWASSRQIRDRFVKWTFE